MRHRNFELLNTFRAFVITRRVITRNYALLRTLTRVITTYAAVKKSTYVTTLVQSPQDGFHGAKALQIMKESVLYTRVRYGENPCLGIRTCFIFTPITQDCPLPPVLMQADGRGVVELKKTTATKTLSSSDNSVYGAPQGQRKLLRYRHTIYQIQQIRTNLSAHLYCSIQYVL